MFTITTEKLSKESIDNLGSIFEYHCVYILANGTHAYVGQTSNVEQRFKQHVEAKNYIRDYNFKTIHIISGDILDSFDETPSKHFEYLLIKLMKVDKKFRIINKKPVNMPHYDRVNKFELYFDKLWPDLVKNKLVKQKKFETIINSGAYKYSPDTILNHQQQKALDATINIFNSNSLESTNKKYNKRVVLVSGNAGTGKTVYATSLLHYFKTNELFKGQKIALMYSQPSMRESIKKALKGIEGIDVNEDIIPPIEITKKKYDIIICDEAHRLRWKKNIGKYATIIKQGNDRLGFDDDKDELDWIFKNSHYQILIYDSKQTVVPSDIDSESFEKRVGISLKEHMHYIRPVNLDLDEQMRIGAGDEYVSYIYDILQGKPGLQRQVFENYEFRLIDDLSEMVELIRQKEKDEGLSRLCGGYAWKWKKGYPLNIDGVELWWNSRTSGWLENDSNKDEVGSIYTLAGLDLNFAGVMIGPDLAFDKDNDTIEIDKAHIFDRNVKVVKDIASRKRFILNAYAVLMTRGVKGTFVYVQNKELREYFRRFI